MTVSTFYPCPGSQDGIISSISITSWADAQGGGCTDFSACTTCPALGDIAQQACCGVPVWQIIESFVQFDTSSIGCCDTICSFTFTVFGNGVAKTDQLCGVQQVREHDWGTSLTTADWIDGSTATNWTNLTLFASLDTTCFVTTDGCANDFTSACASCVINLAGDTRLAMAVDQITSVCGPPAFCGDIVEFSASEHAGTCSDPKLVVTHTAPATGGPSLLQLLGIGHHDRAIDFEIQPYEVSWDACVVR